ncbi:coiled-coil domain-containing protein 134-like [Bacillus rossius redtenbacheri]|uniref:coiled-coil domain-containing protein 134-like n=1 Tax=Bacillus rossius redtenbacheri TaxID=93214 RepID=UPI002FDDB5C6
MEYRIPLAVSFCCFTLVISEFDKTAKESEDVNEGSKSAEQLFTRLFKHKRAEQLDAVKRLVALERSDNQHKMVTLIAEKVFSTIQSSRAVLEGSGYIPGSSAFPEEENTRDALAKVLENTALFGDLVLRLPGAAAQVLRSRHEWEVLYHWSLSFSSQTSLLDTATRKLVHLVEQELNITERSPNYINPYRKQQKKQEKLDSSEEKKRKSDKKAKEKKRKRGPRITLGEL